MVIRYKYILCNITTLLFLLNCETISAQKDDKKSKIYNVIEDRQKKFGAHYSRVSNDSAISLYKRAYELSQINSDLKALKLKPFVLPQTNYETIFQRTQLNDIEKIAIPILKKYNIDTSSVFYSNVFCKCLNAQSVPLEMEKSSLKGNWLIEYNDGLITYLNKLSLFTTSLCPPTGNLDSLCLDPKEYYDFLNDSNNFILFYNFGSLLLADIASEPFYSDLDSLSFEDCQNFRTLSSINTGMQYFVLFHELSHIILKHHAKLNMLSFFNSDSNDSSVSVQIKIPSFYEKYEFEADSLALLILLDRSGHSLINLLPEYKTVNAPYKYAPLIFFSYLDAFQKFEFKNLGNYRGSTHPPAIERRNHLINLYLNLGLMPKENDDFGNLIHRDIKILYDYYTSEEFKDSDKNMKKFNSKAKQCRIKEVDKK